MSSRAPIQIDSQVKEMFDTMKTSGSASEFLETLMKYKAKEKNHLLLEDSVRDEFNALKNKLNVRDINELLKLLMLHFSKSEQMPTEIFNYYLSLKKGY